MSFRLRNMVLETIFCQYSSEIVPKHHAIGTEGSSAGQAIKKEGLLRLVLSSTHLSHLIGKVFKLRVEKGG